MTTATETRISLIRFALREGFPKRILRKLDHDGLRRVVARHRASLVQAEGGSR